MHIAFIASLSLLILVPNFCALAEILLNFVLKTNMISIDSGISKGTHVKKTEFKDIEIKKTTYTVRIKAE